MLKTILLLTSLTASALAAKTDLAGCTLTIVPLLTEIVTTTGVDGVQTYGNYAQTTFQWDGTEQCQLLDCGGGRAPPNTNSPGCPGYTGTATVPSLPFPTASLTLNQVAAPSSISTAAPGVTSTPDIASGTEAPGPVAMTSPPSSLASSVSPSGTAAPAIPATSDTPTTAVTTGSVAQSSPLNPTSASNSALAVGVKWNVVPGVAGFVVAALCSL